MTREDGGRLALAAGAARATVCPAEGGRLGSLRIAGRELLVTDETHGPMQWGSYPMAPWAGRTADGRFRFAGREHRLPITMPPHAIHGVAYDRPWSVVSAAPDRCRLSLDLDKRWPFRGRVTLGYALAPGFLEVTLTLEAAEPMPAVVGWHPWFRRVLAPGSASVRLAFSPATMLLRGPDGIPTGERVAPPPGPWDDAFTGLAEDPVLEWPGQLRLVVSSTCPWWVVYSVPEHAICVEPQSGPPDGLNGSPAVVEPGTPLVEVMTWRWSRPGEGAEG